MKLRIGLTALGLGLVLAGILLPTAWYDALPANAAVAAPPIKGVTLLRISLMLEGLAVLLVAVSLGAWSWGASGRPAFYRAGHRVEAAQSGSPRAALWALAGVTALALTLRLIKLDADLWLDEIMTVVVYAPMSWLEVIGGYVNFNNHLLNTLLIKLAIGVFGEQEWAIRLPVALLGTATIPVVYWISREMGLPRGVSLGIALLLAVSYHHIFFSQNARGYIGHVLFSLMASGILVKGLQTDRTKWWVSYVAVMILNFAFLLVSAYVLIAHVLVGAVALFLVARRGETVLPLLRRLGVVFAVTGFLAFQLYALILPQAYARAQSSYASGGGYFTLLSGDFLVELIRNISASLGVGTGPQALLALLVGSVIAGTGLLGLLRRNWALTLALATPGILHTVYLITTGGTFSPRFFLLALPLAIIAVVQGVYLLAQFIGGRFGERQAVLLPRVATVALVLLVFAVSLASLKTYYSVPKQAYSASLEYLETRREAGQMVLVVDLAAQGYRYYGGAYGVKEDRDYFFVQSLDDLEAVLATQGPRKSYVVTTLPRFLDARKPDLAARIQQDWQVLRTFPATIGNGQISVWTQNQP